MPVQPKRICTYPGCNTLVLERRCQQHPYPPGQRRVSSSSVYRSKAWKRTRLEQLSAYPFCQYRVKCDGAPAVHVDHRDNNQHNNEPRNLASCCHACHSHKTATQDMTRDGGKFDGKA